MTIQTHPLPKDAPVIDAVLALEIAVQTMAPSNRRSPQVERVRKAAWRVRREAALLAARVPATDPDPEQAVRQALSAARASGLSWPDLVNLFNEAGESLAGPR